MLRLGGVEDFDGGAADQESHLPFNVLGQSRRQDMVQAGVTEEDRVPGWLGHACLSDLDVCVADTEGMAVGGLASTASRTARHPGTSPEQECRARAGACPSFPRSTTPPD